MVNRVSLANQVVDVYPRPWARRHCLTSGSTWATRPQWSTKEGWTKYPSGFRDPGVDPTCLRPPNSIVFWFQVGPHYMHTVHFWMNIIFLDPWTHWLKLMFNWKVFKLVHGFFCSNLAVLWRHCDLILAGVKVVETQMLSVKFSIPLQLHSSPIVPLHHLNRQDFFSLCSDCSETWRQRSMVMGKRLTAGNPHYYETHFLSLTFLEHFATQPAHQSITCYPLQELQMCK